MQCPEKKRGVSLFREESLCSERTVLLVSWFSAMLGCGYISREVADEYEKLVIRMNPPRYDICFILFFSSPPSDLRVG